MNTCCPDVGMDILGIAYWLLGVTVVDALGVLVTTVAETVFWASWDCVTKVACWVFVVDVLGAAFRSERC